MGTVSMFVQRFLVDMEKGARPDPTGESEMEQTERKPSKRGLVLIAGDRAPGNQWKHGSSC